MNTKITSILGIKYPIIGAPMFLVSGPDLVASVSNAGGIGTFTAMSYRNISDLRHAVKEIFQKTSLPFGMNIVLHPPHNPLWKEQFQLCIEEKIPLVITSMGTPRSIVKEAHLHGIKVFCDVVHLKQALVAEKAGADAIIAVCQGAGGHAGNISPFALIPQLKENLKIPVIAAGAISSGVQMAAAFILGADAVYVGTRFIATPQALAENEYKQEIINADPRDIVYSSEISGVPANWLKKSYDKWKLMKENPQQNIRLKNWIDLWSAGHGVAQIQDIENPDIIINKMISEYEKIKKNLP